MNDSKICSKCKNEKDLEMFRNSKTGKKGKKAYCIECDDTYNKKRYNTMKEIRINQIKNWNSKHPDKLKQYKKTWISKQI